MCIPPKNSHDFFYHDLLASEPQILWGSWVVLELEEMGEEVPENEGVKTDETPGHSRLPSTCAGFSPRGRAPWKTFGHCQDAEEGFWTPVPSTTEILGFWVGTKQPVWPKLSRQQPSGEDQTPGDLSNDRLWEMGKPWPFSEPQFPL